ncbi:MAG: hypothetical protein K0R46_2290 [Herbinix sp.]|nr:hypothetical protein [Herbinix sp.]
MNLIPEPKNITMKNEADFLLRYNNWIIIDTACDLQVTEHAMLLKREISHLLGFDYKITKGEKESGAIYLSIRKELHREEYHLHIKEDGIDLYGGSNAGILYAIQTLRQLLETKGAILPCLMIEDEPDIQNRGFYHDVTRGRIPTLDSLKALADKLAYYKLNQLQLYIEHSFMFRDFSEVWRDDTPLTPQDILEFDRYCRKLHIDLIPSIASFGHLYKVLRTKSYSHLCELENSDQELFSFYERMAHHTLDISREESFQFVTKMIDEYMPLFSSDYFNLCADETFDLGKGRSKALAEQIGTDTMYINFVKRICEYITGKGKKPMFWGDIICGMPETVKELPKEAICLNWGYAPDHSDRETRLLQEAGAIQYVCPGVSGWNQLVNRFKDAYDNISRMCTYAFRYNAVGILNTDWGDFGHINHPEFSTTGLIYGAAFSWNKNIPAFESINSQISELEYGDVSGKFLSVVAELATMNAVSWFEIICFKELQEKSLNRKPYAPVLEEISGEIAHTINEQLDENIIEFYHIMSEAKQEKRYLYKAYILAAEGMKLWNEIGALVAGNDEKDEKKAERAAIRLEYWYQEYKQLWRSVSRESELYRISEVVFWYCDYLRTIKK